MTSTAANGIGALQTRGRAVGALLWTCQILLALAFLAHGIMLLFPPAEIAVQLNTSPFPRWFWVFLGIAEVLAFVGLTLPAVARRERWLIAWAAGGIMIVMVSATVWHVARNEISSAVTTLVLLVMATWVAAARRRDYPRN